MRQNYSEIYFDIGIIAVEISRAGPTTTVFFSRILDIGAAFAANTTVIKISMLLIRINLYHKKEIVCVYHTNWYNTN